MDGVFVLDVSKSIGKTKFNDMKDFTLSIINLMDVSPECSRAGLILFVENALIKFALNEHLTPTRLRDAIDQIKYEEHSSSGTNTPQALRLLRAGGKNGTLGLRDGKIHFAVFITDGKTYLGRNKPQNEMADQITKLAAYELHRARLYNQIYAIGIKTKNQKTISYIADPPSLAFSLAEFNQSLLNQVRINISKDLCDGELNYF